MGIMLFAIVHGQVWFSEHNLYGFVQYDVYQWDTVKVIQLDVVCVMNEQYYYRSYYHFVTNESVNFWEIMEVPNI